MGKCLVCGELAKLDSNGLCKLCWEDVYCEFDYELRVEEENEDN